MKLGFIGLGKMGSRIALKLLESDHDVVVWNRSFESVETFKKNYESGIRNNGKKQKKGILNSSFIIHDSIAGKLTVASTIRELVTNLESTRVVWLMLPAGEATQTVLDEVAKYVQSNDIVIDGGNSHYKDTQKRSEKLKTKSVKYLGIGVSGGVIAAKEGYPLMVGGDKSAYQHIKPILNSLAKPRGGHAYFGKGGAGHFVKMVHNGIEYGIMQSLGEGFEVLEKAPYQFDLLKIAKLWQKGTLVSGFMLDRTVDALRDDTHLEHIIGVIDATGEAQWAINQAKEEGVDVEIIERSLAFRKRSQTDKKVQNSFTGRLVAALRLAFGGHSVKKK